MFRLSLMIAIAQLATQLSSVNAANLERRLRRPTALAVSSDGNWLYTANRDSGSISVVEIANRSVVKEIEVGGRLVDLAVVDDTHLVALDSKQHQLVLLRGAKDEWKVALRLKVAEHPIRLMVDQDRRCCFVAGLWSRTVSRIDLSAHGDKAHPRLHIEKEQRLSFEPREMCLSANGRKLIVADSFGGQLAVMNSDSLEFISTKNLPGHNVRGLAMSGDGKHLLVSQQELNPLARSNRDDVHWGNMISNQLASLPVDEFYDPKLNGVRNRTVTRLGEPGNAAGDPGKIVTTKNGKLFVLLSGVNEVAIGRNGYESELLRVKVGRHPTDAVSVPDGSLFIADQFSDSVSIVDPNAEKRLGQISLGPQPELSLANRGEMLFFDSRISHDGWMSCQSCHTDGHTNGHLNDNHSDGSFDTPKRVLSLLGAAQTRPWAWNGKMKSLDLQVASSIENTLQGSAPKKKQVAAIVAYLKTLPPPPVAQSGKDSMGEIRRGAELFQSLNCTNCHKPPTYTTSQTYDVGLSDSAGNRQFNPPSLRGVGRRMLLFHDGRATSLKDVFTKHKHQLKRELSAEERDALLGFLKSL